MAKSFLKFEETKVGDKVKFVRIHEFWFTDIVNNAMKLNHETIYTISEMTVLSSWVSIKLVETGDLEYSLSFFGKP